MLFLDSSALADLQHFAPKTLRPIKMLGSVTRDDLDSIF
jgi:hypothetical protein